jgi:hypothetical protein
MEQASDRAASVESPPASCALSELRRVRIRRGRPRLPINPHRIDAASPLRSAITCCPRPADGDPPPLPSAVASGADEALDRLECMRRHPSGRGAR